ncbi:MAG: CoB--CoM heterodisulfide reductase iron-sulfur subunit B family protein [Dehalococcoidales bacterium]|nr:CoB--CoM heterodisulfide reductase iron-sulfur subunit B family protein [Dehalococcoidales bacterium]
MRVSYYPGCSLEGTAKEFDVSTRAVCKALGIELQELEDWSCCGATSAHSTNDYLAVALPARNLTLAEKTGLDLVTPCAACFQRLKVAEKKLAEKPLAEFPYQGKIKIDHLLNLCTRPEAMEKIKSSVKKPLKGLKVVCYYGCLTTRPPKITDAVNYENPQNMDELILELGAESIDWSYKTACCGNSLVLGRADIVKTMVGKLLEKAREAGADAIVTCCPMCQSNLESGRSMPVFYFTELMGMAMGLPGTEKWLKQHLVNPVPLASAKGLI